MQVVLALRWESVGSQVYFRDQAAHEVYVCELVVFILDEPFAEGGGGEAARSGVGEEGVLGGFLEERGVEGEEAGCQGVGGHC